MKRIKALNGFTIYLSNERDEKKYCNISAGYYYIYFSSDIREYGISENADYYEYEAGTIEEAISLISDYETIEYVEARTSLENEYTYIDYEMIEERIEELKKIKSAGIEADEIKEAIECGYIPKLVKRAEEINNSKTDTLIIESENGYQLQKYNGENLDEYPHIMECNHTKLYYNKVLNYWFMENITINDINEYIKNNF